MPSGIVYEILKNSILESPVIDKGGYPYLVHPVTDGIPRMAPEMLEEIIDWMFEVSDFDCDVILAPESMGIPLAVPISLNTGVPYAVIRKRQYSLPGEIVVPHKTGYSNSTLYVNGINPGDRVIIIDDVLSTGGTLTALMGALKANDVKVVDVIVVFDKGSSEDIIERSFDIDIKIMLKISFENGRPVVTEVN